MSQPDDSPKQYDIAWVDFDETLFATERFKQALVDIFKKNGVPEMIALSTMRQAEESVLKPMYFDYTFERHCDRVQSQGIEISLTLLGELHAVLRRSEEFVYEEAAEFMRVVRHNAARVILLSSGNYSFQRAKIDQSGLATWFDEIIIVRSHKETILDYLTQQGALSSIFINDNLAENKIIREFLPSVTIVSKINSAKFSKAEYENSGMRAHARLKEIAAWIERP